MAQPEGLRLLSLRPKRLHAGYSNLKELAEKVGAHKVHLSRIERGEGCSKKLAERIATALACSVDELTRVSDEYLPVQVSDSGEFKFGFAVGIQGDSVYVETDARVGPVPFDKSLVKTEHDLTRLPIFYPNQGGITDLKELITTHHIDNGDDPEIARVKTINTIDLIREALGGNYRISLAKA